MRSSRPAVRRTAVRPVVAWLVAVAWMVATALPVLAATPSPSDPAIGDPRSSGQGPGLVGDPLLAIGIVVGIGLLALVVTLLYVRATGGPRTS